MPGKSPTLTEQVKELTDQLRKLEAAFENHRTVTNLKVQRLEERDAEHTRIEDELRDKVAEQAVKNAALEERSRHQEKTSDRGWQLWLAALGFGFGLLSLLVTAALQLRK